MAAEERRGRIWLVSGEKLNVLVEEGGDMGRKWLCTLKRWARGGTRSASVREVEEQEGLWR